ncbi:hypothetical protein FOC1_g10005076, partial [Fusarium oxysporum f. sp. cubense race 1]
QGCVERKKGGQDGDPDISVAHATSGKEGSRMLLGIKIFRGISTAKSRGNGHLWDLAWIEKSLPITKPLGESLISFVLLP